MLCSPLLMTFCDGHLAVNPEVVGLPSISPGDEDMVILLNILSLAWLLFPLKKSERLTNF